MNNATQTEATPTALRVSTGSASEKSRWRIARLADPATLDALFDEFEDMGMPFGSDRWAEYCLERLRELREKEQTLRHVLHLHDAMTEARGKCFAHVHVACRQKMTAEFQQRNREAES